MNAFRNSYSAVIFDLDGTLVDSAPDIAAALNATLETANFDTLSLQTVIPMIGGGANVLIERALKHLGASADQDRVAALLDAFLEFYAAAPCQRSRLYPGTLDVLNALRQQGRALGICTNKPDNLTYHVLEGLGLRAFFSSVVAASPALPPKPAPDMLLKVLRDLNTTPANALMIGDSSADVGTARAAGVPCILLSHGYSTIPVHDLSADAVVASFAELQDMLGARIPHQQSLLP